MTTRFLPPILVLAGFVGTGCGGDNEPAKALDAGPAAADGSATDAAPDTGNPLVDLDIAVARFNADGTLDTSFGTGGIARIDFGPGNASARDVLSGLARDAQNRLVLFGSRKGDGPRSDADRIVMRLTTTGAVDSTFGTMGAHTLNISNLTDIPKQGIVQPDGKIVASGYASQPTGVGAQAANRVVLLRLDDAGKPDPTFGFQGIVNSAPFVPADPLKTEWGYAEAYAVALQSGKYVTTGYGRSGPSGQVDVVSLRYLADGTLDRSWGTNGVAALDVAADNDRGRHLVTLPGDRLLVLGSAALTGSNINAMAVVLQPNGALDTSFAGDGYKLYDFGRPEEAFFGAAVSVSGNWAAGAGYRAGAANGVMEDDDALLLLLPIGGTSGQEFAKATPLSETHDDRFWAVAYGADDKAYAAGYISDGSDTKMVVARFDTTGALDPTFGMGGIASVNVSVGPGLEESARGVIVQTDGKVVVAGPFEKR